MNSDNINKLKQKTKHIQEKLAEINFLSKCNPKLRKYVLEHADKKLIFVLNECMVNFLKGNIKLDEINFQKLKKHKNSIRLLVNSNCLKKKKKILAQKGGFLPFVLPLVGKAFSLLL
jgi:hypothetical protein